VPPPRNRSGRWRGSSTNSSATQTARDFGPPTRAGVGRGVGWAGTEIA
jgi:hypothetical protein